MRRLLSVAPLSKKSETYQQCVVDFAHHIHWQFAYSFSQALFVQRSYLLEQHHRVFWQAVLVS